jgi:hypothetical protein
MCFFCVAAFLLSKVSPGQCPAHTCPNGTFTSGTSLTVSAGQEKCISGAYTVGTITVSGGTLYIEAGASIDMATRMKYAPRTSSSITRNCGTVTWSAVQDYDMKNGTPPGAGVIATAANFMTTENYGSWTVSNGAGKTFYIDDFDRVLNYGSMTFTGNVELRQQTVPDVGYFFNDVGSTTSISGNFNVKGTVDQKGTLITHDLTIVNSSNTTINLFDGSLTRVTNNLYTNIANRVFAPSGFGTAYINNIPGTGTNTGANNITSDVAGLIKYCGPYINGAGACGKCGTATPGAGCPYPLPIELVRFTAAQKGESALLSWTTGSEIDNDYFTVERSDDAINYQMIGIVKGAGNSLYATDYTYIDKQPLPGQSYYRLKQTDFNSHFEIFPPVGFSLAKDFPWLVYPNPAEGQVYISFYSQEEGLPKLATIEVTDLLGNQVIHKSVRCGNSPINIFDTGDIVAKGYYNLKITEGSHSKFEKLIIK